jgi:hypothetical protein
MRLSILTFTILLISFVSCEKKIPDDKLLVIENITLGQDSNKYDKQFDSLGIQNKKFVKKILLTTFKDIINSNNYFNTFYTNLFNFGGYKIEHIGIIHPTTLEGTNNNFTIKVLICRAVDPWIILEAESYKSFVKEKYLRQEVNIEVIKKIKNMYIEKYGYPDDISKSNLNSYFAIEDNNINRKYQEDIEATTNTWYEEYFTVTFFEGMDLNGIYNIDKGSYVESTHPYISNLGNERADILKGELNCNAFPYIEYKLNDKAIEILKLNNKKL